MPAVLPDQHDRESAQAGMHGAGLLGVVQPPADAGQVVVGRETLALGLPEHLHSQRRIFVDQFPFVNGQGEHLAEHRESPVGIGPPTPWPCVASNLAVFNDELGFLLGAAILAPPPHGNPLWMLVDPLRDVGLRIHDALIERHASRERKMQFFALTR
jgi:hypothetical protein